MNDDIKKGRGRPKFDSAQEKRNKRLPVVQVSKSELEAYKAASKRDSKTFSAWVRGVLDKASK